MSIPTSVEEAAAMIDPDELQEQQQANLDPEYAKTFEYSECLKDVKDLMSAWKNEFDLTESRRKLRIFDIDPKKLRDEGSIKPDETFITIRTIDSNIAREKPAYINFLKNGRRLVTMNSMDDPNNPYTQKLEDEVTRGMTYAGCWVPHYEEVDGSLTHGWDALEVEYDTTKPLHCGISHVGHDDLLFPTDSKDIQACQKIARRYRVTLLQLDKWVKRFGFDAEQVSKLRDKLKDSTDKQKSLEIFKIYCKYNGCVYVSWISLELGCSDYLKKPEKLFLGIKDLQMIPKTVMQMVPSVDPLTGMPTMSQQPIQQMEAAWVDREIELYPIFLFRYKRTEESKIFDTKGRAFLDRPHQEALTSLWTSLVNGTTRASNIMASPKNPITGAAPKQLDLKLEGGCILSEPMEFFHTPYPDMSVVGAAQALDVQGNQQVGQTNFAVQNKKGSRTTATEVEQADKQRQLISSVDLTLYSEHIREVYSFAWLIIQSQALQEQITLLVDPNTGSNNLEVLKQRFDIRAAGDIDVIARAEMLQSMKEFWPIIQLTGLKDMFLAEMVRIAFPATGEAWAKQLLAGDPKMSIIMKVAAMLPTLMQDPSLDATGKQQLMIMQQEIQQVMQQAQGNAAPPQPQPPTQDNGHNQEATANS